MASPARCTRTVPSNQAAVARVLSLNSVIQMIAARALADAEGSAEGGVSGPAHDITPTDGN